MKSENIALSQTRNDEHFQFHTEFRTLVNRHGAISLKIGPQFEVYLPLYDREDEALKKIMKSAITADIQEMDKRRDVVFRGMIDANKSALNHFHTEVQEAARRLKIVFDTYGNLARKPLNEETSGIYNLLQDLNGKYAADVAKVGIADWVAELETLNNAFAALMRDRFEESAMRTDIVLKQARIKLDEAYRTITERINALVIVDGAEPYTDFIKFLNAVIAKYTAALAKRTGKSKKV